MQQIINPPYKPPNPKPSRPFKLVYVEFLGGGGLTLHDKVLCSLYERDKNTFYYEYMDERNWRAGTVLKDVSNVYIRTGQWN